MKKLDALSAIANDLTAVLNAEDRYRRLLSALQIAVPYDSVALFRVKGHALIPLAAKGLPPTAMASEYNRKNHPRLDIICGSTDPVFFASDSSLADPFDGLLAQDKRGELHIHACLGCPLYVREKLVGVLVFDAVDPKAFSGLPETYIKVVASIAGAQLQTVDLFAALEEKAKHQELVASDLMLHIHQQRGSEILGKSSAIRELKKEIELVAKSDFTVLVQGETGVGKELVARSIHRLSSRRDKPMLYLNCAALPESLAESELFGHVKGSFTGATHDRTGKFQLADKSTLFLDEVGELPLEVQAKILRAIQEGEIQKVGSEKVCHVDVRLLAATNRNLEQEVIQSKFRADLYHRLNVYPLKVPPLRERKDDIGLLANFFTERTKKKLALEQVTITHDALVLLSRYSWPGNVRELENILSRALLKSSALAGHKKICQITPDHLSSDLGTAIYASPSPTLPDPQVNNKQHSLRDEVNNFQVNLILSTLEQTNGNWSAAAKKLDMNRSNLHNLATRLGLRKKS